MENLQLSILFLLFCVTSLVKFSVSQVSPDASSMEALKSSLKLPSDVDWSDPNPCKWVAVQCDRSQRVTRIQLKSKGIKGFLPPDLKNLSALIILEFFENQLTGSIPDLSGLQHLQRLNLRDNLFTSIPKNIFSGMTVIQNVSFNNNPLSPAELPDSIKEATTLEAISFINCNISGNLPDFLGAQTFPGLKKLHLSFNYLEGELPASFAGSLIQSLWLNGQRSQTKLHGSISVLQRMTSLTEVWLHGNHFSGQIPDLSGLQSLSLFNVRDNDLTGVVPESLVKLPSLKVVNLTHNMLQGRAPKFAPGVHADMFLKTNSFCSDDLDAACDPQVDNLLSIIEPWGYPTTFASSWKGNDPCNSWVGITCSESSIAVITFKGMGLSGPISPSFANITSLQTILLADNALTGPIPTELTTLPQLSKLDVSTNNLSGVIPKFRENMIILTEGNPNLGQATPPSANRHYINF